MQQDRSTSIIDNNNPSAPSPSSSSVLSSRSSTGLNNQQPQNSSFADKLHWKEWAADGEQKANQLNMFTNQFGKVCHNMASPGSNNSNQSVPQQSGTTDSSSIGNTKATEQPSLMGRFTKLGSDGYGLYNELGSRFESKPKTQPQQ